MTSTIYKKNNNEITTIYCTKWRCLFLVLSIFAIYLIMNAEISDQINDMRGRNKINKNKFDKIKSGKGLVDFEEIMQNAYKPNGFDVDLLEFSIISKLKLKKNQTCDQIYDNWLNASKNDIPTDNPLILLKNNFTLNGYSTISECYFNDSYKYKQLNNDEVSSISKKWTKQNIDEWITQIKDGNNSQLQISQYPDGISLYYATKYYNIIAKIGAVIGSYIPWVETMCLANGASKIVTIDYQPIKIGHEDIIYLNAFDFVKRRNKILLP
uniref:Uncharacterized protein n=1 Tax=Meloidogyne enterolobii TaxID=390850 RepID=A0A6V7V1Y6_MELEN|nr:unnamed protein product [Meloidogyne enterolobii]